MLRSGSSTYARARKQNERAGNPTERFRVRRGARMVTRADTLGHTEPHHYLWCASQRHKLDPTKPASNWHTAWRALRDKAGLPGLRFHDLRHTVVTRLLEAGEPEVVVIDYRSPLARMLEHYSHIRLSAKKAALIGSASPQRPGR